jgi:hypothetical protein
MKIFDRTTIASEDIKILDLDLTTSDVTFKRIDEKPAVFDTPTPSTPQANFDVFWDSFTENYAMFLLKDLVTKVKLNCHHKFCFAQSAA